MKLLKDDKYYDAKNQNLEITDKNYVRNTQYNNGNKLSVRIQLHEHFSSNKYPWHKWVFDQLDLSNDSDILELGCGTADLWVENKNRLPNSSRIVLSDFSIFGILGIIPSRFMRYLLLQRFLQHLLLQK